MDKEWLMTLLGGLGGAFTGVGAARERRATEEERKRLADQNAQMFALQKAGAEQNLRNAYDEAGMLAPNAIPESPMRTMPPGMGAMSGIPVGRIMDAARRGETIDTPVGTRQLDRLSTRRARADQERVMAREEARDEINRRLTERKEQNRFTAEQNRLDREARAALERNRMERPAAAGAPRTPTEAQEKSYIYAGFMRDAEPTIASLSGKVDADRISFALSPTVGWAERATGPGAVSNRILGEDEQLLLNAARNFTAGVLRKESGAAIRDDELRQTFERFIPLSGDSPALRRQKEQNRKAVQEMMTNMALPATEYYKRIQEFYPGSSVGDEASTATGEQPPSENWLAAYEAFRNRGNP